MAKLNIKRPEIRSMYDIPVDEGIDFAGDVGYTKQEFKDECDVNNIMSKYMQFGVLPSTREATFGDYTDVPSLLEAQAVVQKARDDFALLPSKVRERFHNDPLSLLAFLGDKSNLDEAVRLGLAVKPPEPEVAPVVVAPPAK